MSAVKRLLCLVAAAVTALTLTACSLPDISQIIDKSGMLSSADTASDAAIALPRDPNGFKSLTRADNYYYSTLSADLQRVYDSLYDNVAAFNKNDFFIKDCTANEVAFAFRALLFDSPQMVWLGSNCSVSEESGGTWVTFGNIADGFGFWISDREQTEKRLADLYAIIDKFVAESLSPDMTAFDIELAVHDWLCTRLEYDSFAADKINSGEDTSPASWSAADALISGSAVCTGYARLMQLVLNYVGINSVCVTGTGEGVAHIWNKVLIDGSWYNVDATWDDKEYFGRSCVHDYFNFNDDVFAATHEFYPTLTADELENELPAYYNMSAPAADFASGDYYSVKGLKLNPAVGSDKLTAKLKSSPELCSDKVLELCFTDEPLSDSTVRRLMQKYDLTNVASQVFGTDIDYINYYVLGNSCVIIHAD